MNLERQKVAKLKGELQDLIKSDEHYTYESWFFRLNIDVWNNNRMEGLSYSHSLALILRTTLMSVGLL